MADDAGLKVQIGTGMQRETKSERQMRRHGDDLDETQ